MAKQKEKKIPSRQQHKKKQGEPADRRAWGIAVLIFIFSIVLYSNTFDHGYVMDDGAMITDNATTKLGYAGMKQFFKESSVYGATKENYGTYRPLTMATYAFELGRAGFSKGKTGEFPVKEQRIFHILLYALCCVLLFFTLRKLLKNYHPLIPAFSALLFAAHPLHTEVGAFIKSRDELLSLLFICSSLFFLLRSLETGKLFQRIVSIILFLLATFSKESSITFVVIFPLALYFFTHEKITRIIIVSLSYLGCMMFYMFVRYKVLDADSGYMPVINNTLVGAHSAAEKFATIAVIMLLYLKLLFYPHPLTWDYGYNQVPLANWSNPAALISLLVYGALVFFALKGLKKKNIFSFCIIFYLITISISANIFVLISAVMAERFLFVPSIAFCTALACLFTKFLSQENTLKLTPALAGTCALVLVAYTYGTMNRNPDWESNLTLFKAGIEASPNGYRSHSAYAWETFQAGQKEKDPVKKKEFFRASIENFTKALAIYDKQYQDWYNLGLVKNFGGDTAGAKQAFAKSYEINPKNLYSCYNLGTFAYRVRDYQTANKYWREAAAIDPNFENLLFKVGLTYQLMQDAKAAIPFYERYYNANPNNYDVVNNLSVVYRLTGNIQKADEFSSRLSQMKRN